MYEGLRKDLLEHGKVLKDLKLSSKLYPDNVLSKEQVEALLEKSQALCQKAYDLLTGKS